MELRKPEETRPPGKPKCKWWDQVISGTIYTGTSVDVAVDKERSRVLVGAAKS